MAKKRFTDEQIINFLREAEIFISQGKPIKEVALSLLKTRPR